MLPYPTVDSELGEVLRPDEASLAREIALAIEATIRRDYAPGAARRDAHPKAHGCVKAEFRINDALPDDLAHGMFVPGRTYEAWIRFSNAASDATRADIEGDARGMAVKVLGVPGISLLGNDSETATQDFILINHPVFFADDPGRYLSLVKHASSASMWGKMLAPFDLGLKGMRIARQASRKQISNPLQTRYWSMVAYQLGMGPGRRAVKYSVRPRSATVDPIPTSPSHDFLRDALRATLEHGDVWMDFLVQPRTSESMDVEDSMTEWTEEQAPFHAVASIRIPQQTFDTPDQHVFCEALSFTPWHALPEHKPLGVVNRLRKVIYGHISQVRHEMNSTRRVEPHA